MSVTASNIFITEVKHTFSDPGNINQCEVGHRFPLGLPCKADKSEAAERLEQIIEAQANNISSANVVMNVEDVPQTRDKGVKIYCWLNVTDGKEFKYVVPADTFLMIERVLVHNRKMELQFIPKIGKREFYNDLKITRNCHKIDSRNWNTLLKVVLCAENMWYETLVFLAASHHKKQTAEENFKKNLNGIASLPQSQPKIQPALPLPEERNRMPTVIPNVPTTNAQSVFFDEGKTFRCKAGRVSWLYLPCKTDKSEAAERLRRVIQTQAAKLSSRVQQTKDKGLTVNCWLHVMNGTESRNVLPDSLVELKSMCVVDSGELLLRLISKTNKEEFNKNLNLTRGQKAFLKIALLTENIRYETQAKITCDSGGSSRK
jgi:hypothetical protein